MSRTIKNWLRLTFDAAVKQSTYTRKLQPGDLTNLKNVRRPEDGPPEKRTGYDRTTISTFAGGTYTGPATEIIQSDSLIWRDSADQIWAANGATGQLRGVDRRAIPSYQGIQNVAAEGRAHKPLQIVRGTELWQFCLGVAQSGVTGYQLTVLDTTTRQPLLQTTRLGADGIVSYGVALDASNNVWVLFISSLTPTVITAHKWTGYSSGSIAALTTYTTLPGYALKSIDVRRVGSEIVVAATSFVANTPRESVLWWSLLDTTTGAAKASPAPATEAQNDGGPTDHQGCNGVSIADSDGSNGFFYLAYARLVNANDDMEWRRLKVNLTTLAVDNASRLQLVETIGGTSVPIAVSGGYLASNGNEEWATTVALVNGSSNPGTALASTGSLVTYRHVHTAGVTTTTVLKRSAYLAGRPILVGSSWYWLTGFQDEAKAQRGYFLLTSSGAIVTQILDGEGAEIFHAGGLAGTFDTAEYQWQAYSGHVVNPLLLPSGDVSIPLLRQGLTALSPFPVAVTVDMSPDCFSTAPGILPGGIPKRVSPTDDVVELSPIHAPYEALSIVNNGGEVTEHSENVCSYRYLTQDSDGKIYVSAAYALQTLTFLNYATPDTVYTIRVPTLRHVVGQTFIALYGSANGDTTPYLQRVFVNNPAVDYIDLPVAPLAWADTGEALETLGSALDQAPLPPCTLACVHRDRLFFAGTPDDSIWPSQEFEAGRGPEFNEALAFTWGQGTGSVRALCSLSTDALIVFRQDAIGVVAGPGPDGNAQNGAYIVATVATSKGTTNPRSVVRGPFGNAGAAAVYFQAAQDNRIYATTGGVPIEVGQGVEDYRALTIVGAVHDEAARLIRFFCSDGTKLILDTNRPTDASPAGQWYVDTVSGWGTTIGATQLAALEPGTATAATTYVQGTSYTDDGSQILMDVTYGPLAPGGPQSEFDTHTCQLSSTRLGGDSNFLYTLTDSVGTAESHTDVADATADVEFMTGLNRTREFTLRIQETEGTGRGRVFDGLAIEIGVYPGRLQNPRRRIQ